MRNKVCWLHARQDGARTAGKADAGAPRLWARYMRYIRERAEKAAEESCDLKLRAAKGKFVISNKNCKIFYKSTKWKKNMIK